LTGPAEVDEALDDGALAREEQRVVEAACAAGRHWYRRDRTAPDDRQWTCTRCGTVAPEQPGVGKPGQSLGWPA
jgi:hypothetical protein